MRKRIISSVITFLILAFLIGMPVSIQAEPTQNVYDDALLLSEEEAATLSEEIDALEEKTGWVIFAVSTEDAQGKSAMAYGDDFFDNNTAEDASGVVFLIDMDNREVWISTCGEAIRYLTDKKLDNMLDNCYGYVSEAEYFSCFEAMVNDVEYYYDCGIEEGQQNYDVETGAVSRYHGISLMETGVALLLAVGAGILFFGFIVGKYRLKFNTDTYDFRRYGKLNLTNQVDHLVNVTHTQRRIQSSSGGGGGSSSGRSSTHRSSSGRSHGGSGRKF